MKRDKNLRILLMQKLFLNRDFSNPFRLFWRIWRKQFWQKLQKLLIMHMGRYIIHAEKPMTIDTYPGSSDGNLLAIINTSNVFVASQVITLVNTSL